jgi:hypothetical protein
MMVYWRILAFTLGLLIALAWQAWAGAGEIRVDTFDTKSNRTGHVIVQPDGRADFYDVRSNRVGSGRVTVPPPATPPPSSPSPTVPLTPTTKGPRP